MFVYLCLLVDDGSDDGGEGESGSGSDYGEQSGSGFDAEDFFTTDDVTSRKPAVQQPSDSSDNKSSSSPLAYRTTDKRYSVIIGVMSIVVVHFRFRFR